MTITVSGTFTNTGASDEVFLTRGINFSLAGTFSANLAVEHSFDNGNTWFTKFETTTPGTTYLFEPEVAKYRVNCTAYSSGNVVYRVGSDGIS